MTVSFYIAYIFIMFIWLFLDTMTEDAEYSSSGNGFDAFTMFPTSSPR